jgi:hypothetical protein
MLGSAENVCFLSPDTEKEPSYSYLGYCFFFGYVTQNVLKQATNRFCSVILDHA